MSYSHFGCYFSLIYFSPYFCYSIFSIFKSVFNSKSKDISIFNHPPSTIEIFVQVDIAPRTASHKQAERLRNVSSIPILLFCVVPCGRSILYHTVIFKNVNFYLFIFSLSFVILFSLLKSVFNSKSKVILLKGYLRFIYQFSSPTPQDYHTGLYCHHATRRINNSRTPPERELDTYSYIVISCFPVW